VQGHKGSKLAIIGVLGTTQTLAWASSYYLPAILADRIAHDLGISSTWFFAAFSGALVISAMVGPRVGRTVAIAHGHPIGASGAVLTTRLLHSMKRDGLKRGIVTLCIGGGQGIALALERVM
jgi:hypothetical protein